MKYIKLYEDIQFIEDWEDQEKEYSYDDWVVVLGYDLLPHLGFGFRGNGISGKIVTQLKPKGYYGHSSGLMEPNIDFSIYIGNDRRTNMGYRNINRLNIERFATQEEIKKAIENKGAANLLEDIDESIEEFDFQEDWEERNLEEYDIKNSKNWNKKLVGKRVIYSGKVVYGGTIDGYAYRDPVTRLPYHYVNNEKGTIIEYFTESDNKYIKVEFDNPITKLNGHHMGSVVGKQDHVKIFGLEPRIFYYDDIKII